MDTKLLEKATAIIPHQHKLINLISKRVKQLKNGKPPLVEVKEFTGNFEIALRELIDGKITISGFTKTEARGSGFFGEENRV